MMLWPAGAARARALRLGMSGEQEAGQWGAGMPAASLEGDSIRARFRGGLQGELEVHELFPMLCLLRLDFQDVLMCPQLSPSGSCASACWGLSGATGAALPTVGQAAHTAPHPAGGSHQPTAPPAVG